MTGNGGRKKDAAILALLSQRNIEEAARVTGVGARTLYRWMKEPEFDAAYRDAKHATFSQSMARLQQLASPAVTTLGKAMLDPNTPAATRVRAADRILDHAAKAIEIETIEARLAVLEQAVEASKVTD
jgi:transposase-like protein